MHTDFVESMGPWRADEQDTDNQTNQGTKNIQTRTNPAPPPPPETPPK